MFPRKITGSITALLTLLSLAACASLKRSPWNNEAAAVHRAELEAGKIVATAVEPAPVAVQMDPGSLPQKPPPESTRPPQRLHPRLKEWIGEHDPNKIVAVVIAFKDDLEIPRFPALDPNFPRQHPENQEAVAAAELLVSKLQKVRAEAYDYRTAELWDGYRAKVAETFWLVNAVAAQMPLRHVERLSQHKDVLSIVPVDSGEPPPGGRDRNLTNDVIEGRARIASDLYFNLGLNRGYIGLLDSGVRFSHILFQPPAKIDFKRDCVNGGANCNTGPNLNPFDDCLDHGTSSAGILMGNDQILTGTARGRFRGVTDITLDSFKVYPSILEEGRCKGLDAVATSRGFEAAVMALDSVIVAEVQGGLEGPGVISQAANRAFDAGAVVIAANGNFGPRKESVTEPASASRVLGVGAFGVSDGNTIGEQSRGPTPDGRVKPDLQAPTKTETASTGCPTLCSDSDFQTYTGTSGAAPYAAGAAALLRNFIGQVMGSWHIDPGLVYAMMILSSEKPDFEREHFNNVHGAGKLRLPNHGVLRWGSYVVRDRETIEIPVAVHSPQERVDAAIWWPEDGVVSSHNDIDLLIADPAGTLKDWSISVSSVFERAGFPGATSGMWSIRIHGFSVKPDPGQRVYFAIWNRVPSP